MSKVAIVGVGGSPTSAKDAALAFHVIAILLVIVKDLGAHYDAWVHVHEGFEIETFFTSSHYLLYAGWFSIGALCGAYALLGFRAGRKWLELLPPGYNVTAAGFAVFGIGGVVDVFWHGAFGFEANLEAPLSPAHFIVIAGSVLMSLGVLLHAIYRTEARAGPQVGGFGVALGVALLLDPLLWTTWYVNPLTADYAAGGGAVRGTAAYSYVDFTGPAGQVAGFAGMLLMSIIWIAFIVLSLRRFRPPVGSATLIVGYMGTLYAISVGTLVYLPALLTAAISADLVWAWVRHGGSDRLLASWGYNLIAIVFPLVLWSVYFILVSTLSGGLVWPPVVWGGSLTWSVVSSFLASIGFVGSPFPRRWLWGAHA